MTCINRHGNSAEEECEAHALILFFKVRLPDTIASLLQLVSIEYHCYLIRPVVPG